MNLVWVFVVAMLCTFTFAAGHQRGKILVRRHHDPCLHRQGLTRYDTWLPEEPGIFRHRHGRALEWHLGGIAWFLAAKPDREHVCQPQTCGITETLQHHDRCACGGQRFGVWGTWERRNSRA